MKLSLLASHGVAALGLAALLAAPVHAQANTSITNEIVPVVNSLAWSPCSNELIVFNGDLHVVTKVTDDASGGRHVQQHANPINVLGIGLATGQIYRLEGVIKFTTNVPSSGVETYTNQFGFRLIAIGSGMEWTSFLRSHVTVSASGQVNSQNFVVDRITCN